MRLAFWRRDKVRDKARDNAKAPVQAAGVPRAPKAAPASSSPTERKPAPFRAAPETGDLDLRLIWQALKRKRAWIIIPTVVAAVLSISIVNVITPRYKSEARILI